MARVFLISLILCNPLFSQENIDPLDSINKNIKKATRLSALVPGLGQVYNKQYWKIAIIFGGYSVIGHYIKFISISMIPPKSIVCVINISN